jgi:peptide/nickel transport system permease protein
MSPVEEPVTGLHSRERFTGLREKLGSITIATALAYLVLLLAVLWAVVPELFSSYDPIASVPGQQLRAPNWIHFFGTDALGRDVFSRVVHGSVHSLSGAFVATAVGFVVGTALGLLSGSAGGIVDEIIMRVVDVLLSIPALLLALTIIILLGFGTLNASIAVGVSAIAAFARLMRSEVIRVRASDYVEAAIGSGGTLAKVLWRHVLPNALTSVVAFSALQFGSAILQLSTLSFLGYGAPPPTPEWGLLVAEGRNYVATAWWLTAAPGLVVVIVVLAANQVSKSMRSQR